MRWVLLMVVAITPAVSTAHESTAQLNRPRASLTAEELSCTRDGGTVMAVTALAALGEQATGRCVQLSGWYDGSFVHGSIDAVYRQQDEGLTATRDSFAVQPDGSMLVESGVAITGIVRDCRSRPVSDDGGQPLILACLAGANPVYVQVLRWLMPDGLPFHRRTVANAPREAVKLAPMAPGPDRDRIAEVGQRALDAMTRGDVQAVAALMDERDGRSRGALDASGLVHQAQRAMDHWAGSDPAIEILGWRAPDDATGDQRAAWQHQVEAETEGVFCAASADFARRMAWPIATRDLAIHHDRPYVCFRVRVPTSGSAVIELSTAAGILPEPIHQP